MAGIQREYVSNAKSSVRPKSAARGVRSISAGTWYFQRPFGRSVYGT